MNKFEAVLLFSPDLSNPQISNEEKNFEKNIKKYEGKVISIEDWGLRDISFKINKYKKSFYKFYQLEIKGHNIQDIKNILIQNEKILRYLFVKVQEHQHLPSKMINEKK
jgi:small subunit ribosomal protein S6